MPQTAFERDTTYRLFVEAARHWLIAYYLDKGALPQPAKYWVYAQTIAWGNPPGPPEDAPLRGKRIEIQLRVMDYP